jgi:Fic family protein
MYDVSRNGYWEAWIEFFLRGVEVSCRDAIAKAHALQDLQRRYRERIQSARSSALLGRLVDTLFEIPAITVPYAAVHLDVTYHAAQNNIQRLVDLKILYEQHDIRRPKWYFANEIVAVAYHGKPL